MANLPGRGLLVVSVQCTGRRALRLLRSRISPSFAPTRRASAPRGKRKPSDAGDRETAPQVDSPLTPSVRCLPRKSICAVRISHPCASSDLANFRLDLTPDSWKQSPALLAPPPAGGACSDSRPSMAWSRSAAGLPRLGAGGWGYSRVPGPLRRWPAYLDRGRLCWVIGHGRLH